MNTPLSALTSLKNSGDFSKAPDEQPLSFPENFRRKISETLKGSRLYRNILERIGSHNDQEYQIYPTDLSMNVIAYKDLGLILITVIGKEDLYRFDIKKHGRDVLGRYESGTFNTTLSNSESLDRLGQFSKHIHPRGGKLKKATSPKNISK